jgi:ribosomal protein S18 acetylase RimI-like enzyme
MEILQIGKWQEQTGKDAVSEVVNIHLDTFTGFFLTFMGRGFLKQMYRSYITHAQSDILVATEQGKVLGFLAYSSDLSGLYKHMIKKRLIPFAWYSLGAFLRKPKVFFRLIRAFLKPGESEREEGYMEITSIGVSPEAKNRGLGSALIEDLKKRVDFSQCAYITLETDAVNNEAANAFYQKNGFTLARSYETHEGRKMNEYRWKE